MPVVVYYGDESYLLEQAANQLRQEVINPAMASLCHRVYSHPSLATVLEAVGSVSLALGGQTLVELRDFPLLHNASKDNATDTQLEELKSLLENVEPSKVVLFLSSKVDGKIKFPKWLTKNAKFTVRKFESFKFWETGKAVDFVMGYTEQKGSPMAEDAADLLVSSIGTDLRALTNEVDKLALYALNRRITRNDVLLMCNHSDNLFQLVSRWILKEKPADNFRDLQEILRRRHPVEIFATLQSFFNNIFRAVWMSHRGASVDTIAQYTGQKPFAIKNNLRTYQRVPLARWMTLKQIMVDMEWKAKTGRMDGQLALEVLMGA